MTQTIEEGARSPVPDETSRFRKSARAVLASLPTSTVFSGRDPRCPSARSCRRATIGARLIENYLSRPDLRTRPIAASSLDRMRPRCRDQGDAGCTRTSTRSAWPLACQGLARCRMQHRRHIEAFRPNRAVPPLKRPDFRSRVTLLPPRLSRRPSRPRAHVRGRTAETT